MKPISNEIRIHMERCMGIYVNPHMVETTMATDLSIGCSCHWTDEVIDDDFSLEFSFDCDTIDEFVEILGFTTSDDLHRLSQADLMEQFQRGHAEIYCAIDVEGLYHELFFHRNGNQLWARDGEETIHLVTVPLKTPSQYIDYLREHGRKHMIIF